MRGQGSEGGLLTVLLTGPFDCDRARLLLQWGRCLHG